MPRKVQQYLFCCATGMVILHGYKCMVALGVIAGPNMTMSIEIPILPRQHLLYIDSPHPTPTTPPHPHHTHPPIPTHPFPPIPPTNAHPNPTQHQPTPHHPTPDHHHPPTPNPPHPQPPNTPTCLHPPQPCDTYFGWPYLPHSLQITWCPGTRYNLQTGEWLLWKVSNWLIIGENNCAIIR